MTFRWSCFSLLLMLGLCGCSTCPRSVFEPDARVSEVDLPNSAVVEFVVDFKGVSRRAMFVAESDDKLGWGGARFYCYSLDPDLTVSVDSHAAFDAVLRSATGQDGAVLGSGYGVTVTFMCKGDFRDVVFSLSSKEGRSLVLSGLYEKDGIAVRVRSGGRCYDIGGRDPRR